MDTFEESFFNTPPAVNVATNVHVLPMDENNGPCLSPNSLSGMLKRFTQRVLKKVTLPLLETRVFSSSKSKLLIRSTRIVTQPLGLDPVAKHGEFSSHGSSVNYRGSR